MRSYNNIKFVASGQSSQAFGVGNRKERLNALLQPLLLSLIIYVFLVLLQNPIFDLFNSFIKPEAQVAQAAGIYYHILIFSSFFVLADYIIRGWLLGQQKTVVCMMIQISCTSLNILLDLIFVLILHAGVSGVAWATLISQIIAFVTELGYLIAWGNFKKSDLDLSMLLDKNRVSKYLKLNLDFLLRTVFHIFVKNGFLAYGSRLGTVTLAANGIINQINSIMIYALEAIGNTATIYAGKFWGRRESKPLNHIWKINLQAGFLFAIVVAIIFRIFATSLFRIYTNVSEVLVLLEEYKNWIFIAPILACAMDVMTGFFSGCTYIKALRNAAFLSMLIFFISAEVLIPIVGNQGLWIAQCIYWVVTAIILQLHYQPMLKRIHG
ncbi:MAG: MATE family efflux transporter [Clostridiales bacterium]|nr:MATE family efflux transporter [Clostridiales bacterium]